jgi:acetolactate synthase-1/2/3 large subunit
VDIPIVGDARHVLKKMLQVAEEEEELFRGYPDTVADWDRQVGEWKRDYPLSYNRGGQLKPQFVIERVYELTKGKAIVATEVGQNQMWAAQFYKFLSPRRIMTSGGLGTMGYGFPAALGAQVAFPDMMVVDIAGDGSIQMNIQELATAVQYNLPVKVVILNNGCLGMVRQWQELFYGKRYSCSLLEATPNFVKLAEAYGAVGYEIEHESEVDRVLKKAFANGRPTLIDVHVDPAEGVYPMVPVGAGLGEMLLV